MVALGRDKAESCRTERDSRSWQTGDLGCGLRSAADSPDPVFPAEQLRKFLVGVPTQPLSGWVSRWIEISLEIRASQPTSTGFWDPQTGQ